MVHPRVSSLLAVAALFVSITVALTAQNVERGRKSFETRCARCHGADDNGGEMGPPITLRLANKTNEDLVKLVHEGLPTRGMPPVLDIRDSEIEELIQFLRTIQRKPETVPIVRMKATLVNGTTLEGRVMAEGFHDVQLLTDDKRIHLLRR